MIRFLRYIFLGLVALVLVTVALANRAPVVVNALPPDLAELAQVDWRIALPLYVVMFGGIAAGLLIGFVWEWLRERKHRVTATVKHREVSKLERELAQLRDAKGVVQDDVIALLEQKKAG